MATEKHLIYKEDLLDSVLDHFGCDLAYLGEDLQFCQEAIDMAPAVDAVPVVHGQWIDNGMCDHKPARFRNPDKWTIYKCSECGYSNGRRKNANYCPNCGAKMDGGNEDGSSGL